MSLHANPLTSQESRGRVVYLVITTLVVLDQFRFLIRFGGLPLGFFVLLKTVGITVLFVSLMLGEPLLRWLAAAVSIAKAVPNLFLGALFPLTLAQHGTRQFGELLSGPARVLLWPTLWVGIYGLIYLGIGICLLRLPSLKAYLTHDHYATR